MNCSWATSDGSDVVFVVGTGCQTGVFQAHRSILSTHSDVFHAMFYGPLQATEETVHVPDISPAGFQKLLMYVYTESVDFDDLDEAIQVLYASKKYMIQKLSVLSRKFVARNLTVHNVCSMLELVSSITGEEELVNQCLEFICQKTADILETGSFLTLSLASLELILDQDDLQIDSEMCLIDTVLLWAKEECIRQKLDVTSQNKRHVAKSLLKKIRFFTLTAEEFAEVSNVCDILIAEEESVILCNIVRRSVQKCHPNLCSSSKRRCAAPKSCPQCLRTHIPVPNSRSGSQISFGASRGAFGQSVHSNASSFNGLSIKTNLSCPYCGYTYSRSKFKYLYPLHSST